jgi:glutamate synthase domain-containing protein 2
MSPVQLFFAISTGVSAGLTAWGFLWPPAFAGFVIVAPLVLLGLWDVTQREHAVLRNFPVIGHFRYLFEAIRPEIQQYFVESDTDGRPFSREVRAAIYQRAKATLDTRPFGTLHDVYAEGTEMIAHSIAAKHPPKDAPRIRIGEGWCAKPYDSSVLNISAMSYGSLSSAAILALNGGAQLGGFCHNSGEGGISPYHL